MAAAVCLCAQPNQQLLDDWRLEEVLTLPGDLHHVQGIDVEGNQLWVSSVERKTGKGFLYRIALPTGKVEAQVEVQDGARIHPGGIQLDGDSLWVSVAEYRRNSSTNVERRNKQTLALEQRFTVDDHIGCLAADGEKVIGGNWDSRDFYIWSKDGKLLEKRPNPHPTRYQDLKLLDGKLLASGNLGREQGAIEWLRWPDLAVEKRVLTGQTDRGVLFTNEGMALRGGKLYLLPEDAPTRLFRFAPR